jgi:hypothetical protein
VSSPVHHPASPRHPPRPPRYGPKEWLLVIARPQVQVLPGV